MHGHIPARIDHRVGAAAKVGAQRSASGATSGAPSGTASHGAHAMAPPAEVASTHPLVVPMGLAAQLPAHCNIVDLAELDGSVSWC